MRWAKPSKDEVDEVHVKSKLMNSEIKLCGKCWKEVDTSNDDTKTPWIPCDNEIDMEGQYICGNCHIIN